MIITNIVYPVEMGFLWLLRQNGLWGGWRDGPFMVQGGRLVRIHSVLRHEDERCVEYRMFFCILPHRQNGSRWAPTILGPEAGHFDLWGLPMDYMLPFDREYLPKVLKIGLHLNIGADEPLTIQV